MPHNKNLAVYNAFSHTPASGGQRSNLTNCKFCTSYKDMAYNITRMAQHLEICEGYLSDPSNAHTDIVAKVTGLQLKRELSNEEDNEESKPPVKRQQKLEFSAMSEAKTKHLDGLCARAMFESGEPLNLFEDPAMKRFLTALNPAYTPPSRRVISELLPMEQQHSLDAYDRNSGRTTTS